MQPIKLTAAQTWLFHTLETLFFGAIVAGGIAAYQALSTGNYNWQSLGGILVAAAFAVLAKGWSSNIANNANFGQALLDSLNEVKTLVSQQPAQQVAVAQPQGPLVVQHITQLPDTQPVQQPLARVIPQRPQGPAPIVLPQPVVPANPQSVQAVDVAILNTRTTPIVSAATPDLSTVQRNWNDSGLIPMVGTGQ